MMRHAVVLQTFLGLAGIRVDDELLHNASDSLWQIESTFDNDLRASFDRNPFGLKVEGKCEQRPMQKFMKQQKEVCMDLWFPYAGLEVSVGVIGQMEYSGTDWASGKKKMSVTLTGSVIFSIPWTLSVALSLGGSVQISSETSKTYIDVLKYAVSGVIQQRFQEAEMQDDEKLRQAVVTRMEGLEMPYDKEEDWAPWALDMADTLSIFLTSVGIWIHMTAAGYKKQADDMGQLLEGLLAELKKMPAEPQKMPAQPKKMPPLLEGLHAKSEPSTYTKTKVVREEVLRRRHVLKGLQGKNDVLVDWFGASHLFVENEKQFVLDKACEMLIPQTNSMFSTMRDQCSISALVSLNIDLAELRLAWIRDVARSIANQISKLFVGEYDGPDIQSGNGKGDWKFNCSLAQKKVKIDLHVCSDGKMTCYDRFRKNDRTNLWMRTQKMEASGATLCNLFEAALIDPNVTKDLHDYDWQLKEVYMRIPYPIVTVMPFLFHKLRSYQLAAINNIEQIRQIQGLTSASAEDKIAQLTDYIKDQQTSFQELELYFGRFADQEGGIQDALNQARTTEIFHTEWDKCVEPLNVVACARSAIQGNLLQRVNIHQTVQKTQAEMKKIADELDAAGRNRITVEVKGEVSLKLSTTITRGRWDFCSAAPTFQLDTAMSLDDKFNVNLENEVITQAGQTAVKGPTVRATIAPFRAVSILGGTSYSFSIGPNENDPRKHVVSLPLCFTQDVKETVKNNLGNIHAIQQLVLEAIASLVDDTSPVDADPNLYNEGFTESTTAAENLWTKVSQIFNENVWQEKVALVRTWLRRLGISEIVLEPNIVSVTVKVEISLTTTSGTKKLGIQLSLTSRFDPDEFTEVAKKANVQMLDIKIGDGIFIDLTGVIVNEICKNNFL